MTSYPTIEEIRQAVLEDGDYPYQVDFPSDQQVPPEHSELFQRCGAEKIINTRQIIRSGCEINNLVRRYISLVKIFTQTIDYCSNSKVKELLQQVLTFLDEKYVFIYNDLYKWFGKDFNSYSNYPVISNRVDPEYLFYFTPLELNQQYINSKNFLEITSKFYQPRIGQIVLINEECFSEPDYFMVFQQRLAKAELSSNSPSTLKENFDTVHERLEEMSDSIEDVKDQLERLDITIVLRILAILLIAFFVGTVTVNFLVVTDYQRQVIQMLDLIQASLWDQRVLLHDFADQGPIGRYCYP